METRIRPKALVLVAALVAATGAIAARQQTSATIATPPALEALLPTDPDVAVGQFDNGLRYYIRANKKPEHRAELRLVVKAGSVLEDDDQQGLAHMLEHMAFRGTTHFSGSQAVAFMQSVGMRFGPDLNAYTSFDETVYMLTIPTDKPETVATGLLILADWAHELSFDQAEIEKERGVVLEEWRSGRGAGARNRDKTGAITLKGSRYSERIPIGRPEILETFKPERLKQFYRDWYRPDLMAVVAVGDFNQTAVQQLVKAHFAALPAQAAPRPRPSFNVPDRPGTAYAIAADKEATATVIELEARLPGRKTGSVGAYRSGIVDDLFDAMLESRFEELSQQPGGPLAFVVGPVHDTGLGRSCGSCPPNRAMFLFAAAKGDDVARAVETIFREIERVARFGFTPTELDRQKRTVLRDREVAATEDAPSASRASAYVSHFIDEVPILAAAAEFSLHQRFLPEISLAEVSQLASQLLVDRNRIMTITGPATAGVSLPDEGALASAIKAAAVGDLKPYADTGRDAPLLDSIPQPGAVVATTRRDAIGLTEWVLSNGVKVVLKPTTFKNDEVVLKATSPGGTSLASDRDYIPAANSGLVPSGGVGRLSAVELTKYLQGKIASAWPVVDELDEGMNGRASVRDLETMFQLIHLRFTKPRIDPVDFAAEREGMKALLGNQTNNPDVVFAQTLQLARFQNHPRRQPNTPAVVDQWDLEKSAAFYRDRFSDASDFTFVFVGSFDLPMMKPLVERYLGSLPSTHRKETWRDVGVRTPAGVIEKTVEKGIEPKGQTAIVFSGPFDYEPGQRGVTLLSMANILERRLMETIRKELGGTYGVSVSPDFWKIPNPEYSISVRFGHDPLRAEELTRRVFAEIARFRSEGPSEQEVNDERLARLREFETNAQQNNFVANQLVARYRLGEDPASVWDRPDYYGRLTATTIQAAAKAYLNPNRYVRVTLLPEKR